MAKKVKVIVGGSRSFTDAKLLKEKYTFKRRKELFKNFKNVSAWLKYLREL